MARVGTSFLPSMKATSLFPRLHYGFAGIPFNNIEKVFPLPNIAESITEGTVAEFVKK